MQNNIKINDDFQEIGTKTVTGTFPSYRCWGGERAL